MLAIRDSGACNSGCTMLFRTTVVWRPAALASEESPTMSSALSFETVFALSACSLILSTPRRIDRKRQEDSNA
jgi:adenylosuccinate synthase